MKCNKCEYYESNPTWNRYNLTESECFHTVQDCDLVNEDGTVNCDKGGNINEVRR
jgi:hypothetical protein